VTTRAAITHPRTALVVGGGRGIGRETVLQLAEHGTRCAIAYLSREEPARQTQADAAAIGPEPAVIQGDQGTDAPAIVEQARSALGSVDAIVTTAVPMIMGPIGSVTEEEYRSAMDVQVWGLQQLVATALDDLAAAGGSVVTVSSLGADSYANYYGAIGPAKAALENTVRYLAAEHGRRGVRVNAVSPCLVDDPSHRIGIDVPEEFEATVQAVAKRTPMRRLATSAEIASVIVALLSSQMSFVTGQTIKVDGGYSLLA